MDGDVESIRRVRTMYHLADILLLRILTITKYFISSLYIYIYIDLHNYATFCTLCEISIITDIATFSPL